MSRGDRILRRLFVAQVVVLAMLTLLELGTRAWLQRWADEATRRRFASLAELELLDADPTTKRYTPHRYMGYVLQPGYSSGGTNHNSLGFRGPEFPVAKPPGEVRVVCIGGSTTYTSEVAADPYTYPARLEHHLHEGGATNVRVINAGCGGWTTWESLVNLELRLLELQPDVIVIYHAINDVHPRLVWPAEAYQGDASGYRGPITLPTETPPVWERSAFARTLAISLGLADPHVWLTVERRLMDEHPPTYYGDEFRSQHLAGRYPAGIFARVPAARMLATNRPDYFRRNLESMVGVARHRGIEVVLATFASCPDFPDQPRVATEEYRRAFLEMNEVIGRAAGASGARFFDFAAVFPADKELFVDGRHVNERGADLKGQLFARFLLSEGLLPGRR